MLTELLSAYDALPKPSVFKLTTEPVQRVLEQLGRPQDGMPPAIHVAGTNGKGSTTAFMRAVAEAHGLKVHVDTSPHLVRVNERIRIAGELISDAYLMELSARVLEANAGEPLSFFEGMTCVAYLAFAENPADLTLVEVGLGGRFDSTNVIDHPAACVITPIDIDHKEFLGRHICQIAWEKAGIIKKDAPVCTGGQAPDVLRTLKAEAIYKGAPFHTVADAGEARIEGDRITMQIDDLILEGVELGLKGPHQVSNSMLALLGLKRAGVFELTVENTLKGLKTVEWPARMQTLADGPLTRQLPGKTVILDGGHNPHAAAAVAKAISPYAPMPVAFGMLKNKDARSYLADLAPMISHLACIPMQTSQNGADPNTLCEIATSLGIPATAYTSIDEALARLTQEKSDHALICGSLYLAGDVLRLNGEVID
ncbi:bifunctional folylpolyglutamate synthase/dihydrofolate synthase [Ponticaulis koreensis]|uniref:bifunctional folylpolyglutamate synthase/dihydrofolate synthase n=1 Tax=Ponticaulis koreensis TaxID=1123045 RepID=UPI0003B43D49|nr:folylpolyglutamate synthase/dihydrofolate synthase family protein [Ponticaulis koreensis]